MFTSLEAIGLWWGNLKETHHLEDLGIVGRKLKLILQKQLENVDRINLARDINKWQAVPNTVMIFQFYKTPEI
jgi:hypothetical protein